MYLGNLQVMLSKSEQLQLRESKRNFSWLTFHLNFPTGKTNDIAVRRKEYLNTNTMGPCMDVTSLWIHLCFCMVLLSKLYAMLLRCRCLYYIIIHRLAGVHISGMQCIWCCICGKEHNHHQYDGKILCN